MKTDSKLAKLRDEIDAIDSELLRLFSARADVAARVAEVKQANGETSDYYRPEREAQILRRVMEQNPGPLADEEIARLFRELMSACLALEMPTKVAYLGPEGTFTQAAALKHFGASSVTLPHSTIDHVFREVEAGAVHFGVVPIENSTEGVINHTHDRFIHSPLKICGEVELRIHHNLMANEALDKGAIKRLYSHSQSFAQCRQWLDENVPQAERVDVTSNAEAARRAQAEPGSAAIASDVAAQLYELQILSANIEDHPDNTTRFLIIGAREVPPSGNDMTSIMLTIKNQPGALFNLLKPFQEKGIDLSRLESRPSRSLKWNYVFFVDFKGHIEDPAVGDILVELKKMGAELKVLGSYPKAVL